MTEPTLPDAQVQLRQAEASGNPTLSAPDPALVINRMVHYSSHGTPVRPDLSQAYPSRCRPAVVTEVGAWIDDETDYRVAPKMISVHPDGRRTRLVSQTYEPTAAALTIFNPTGQFFTTCRHDPGRSGGTWHWPTPDCEQWSTGDHDAHRPFPPLPE